MAPKTLEVRLNDGGTRVLAGDQVFLNVGTHAAIPSIPGLEAAGPLTHHRGAGARLCAAASDRARRRLCRPRIGAGVPSLRQPRDDHRAWPSARWAGRIPTSRTRCSGSSVTKASTFLLAAETLQVQGRSGEDVSLVVRTPPASRPIEGSDILVAAGRIPNTAGIGLEEAGVELDGRGYIRVNERLETSAPEVWAIGECAGSPQFTHVSVDDFRIIRDNLAGGKPQHARPADSLLHVHRPAARAGRTERRRSATPRRRRARREAADERRAADADDRRDDKAS